MIPIVVTGAAGFLGQAIVAAARAANHPVHAIVRQSSQIPKDWVAGVSVHVADLTETDDLAMLLSGVGVVIHAAAGRNHARDTTQATEKLLANMSVQRLVLVSSFSVYGFAAMPDGAQLDETTPTDPDIARRDSYAQAKLHQEHCAIRKAQTEDLDLWIIRPGALYGPNQTWSARLGYSIGGRVLCPGGNTRIPAIHVDNCAAALVAAATAAPGPLPSDMPILTGKGHVRIVNLTDPDPPTQRDWLSAIGVNSIVPIPQRPLLKLARLINVAGELVPALDRMIPAGLREPILAARFKPLRYSTARADNLLGHRPKIDFSKAIRSDKAKL